LLRVPSRPEKSAAIEQAAPHRIIVGKQTANRKRRGAQQAGEGEMANKKAQHQQKHID
jgi:hypothetical protein